MWNVLGDRVFAADLGGTDVLSFAGFREGVVAGVEVFALLKEDEEVSACEAGGEVMRVGGTVWQRAARFGLV